MSCELLKASVAIFLISTCAVHSQETIIKEINGERYEIGTVSIEDFPEIVSEAQREDIVSIMFDDYDYDDDDYTEEELETLYASVEIAMDSVQSAVTNSSHFGDRVLAEAILTNVQLELGSVLIAELRNEFSQQGIDSYDTYSPISVSNENGLLFGALYVGRSVQDTPDLDDPSRRFIDLYVGENVTDTFIWPEARYFTSRRLPSNDNQHFKPDRYTAAPDVRPANYPTCGGNLWVTGFRVGYGKDSRLFIEHKHQDKCFDEDVIFLPEGLRAYDRGGVTAFLNQPIDYFYWQ